VIRTETVQIQRRHLYLVIYTLVFVAFHKQVIVVLVVRDAFRVVQIQVIKKKLFVVEIGIECALVERVVLVNLLDMNVVERIRWRC
jgi:hypothetical protein